MKNKITILYPLCPSHSGSTLLSILIGSQKNICGVGELFVFSDRPNHIRQKVEENCSCNGKVKEHCPFWQDVERILVERHDITLNDINVESKNKEELRLHNQNLFQAIAEVSKCSIIVDASKVVSRFIQLREAGFNVVPIVFKRNPCALVYSWVKRGYDWKNVSQYYPDFYQEVAKNIPDRKELSITYEEFVADPKPYLKKLIGYLKIDYEEVVLDWNKSDIHTLKGNVVRFQNDSKLKESKEWKSKLSFSQKVIIYLKAFPCQVDQYWMYYVWARIMRLFFWTKFKSNKS